MYRYVVLSFLLIFSYSAYSEKLKVTLATQNQTYYGGYAENDIVHPIANENFRGVSVDIIRCIMQRNKVNLSIQVMPWARAQHQAKAGKVDGFFSASQNDKRDAYAVLSQPIAAQTWNWYWLNDKQYRPNSNSFKKTALVGSFNGANMLNWLEKNDYNVAVRASSIETLFDSLMLGRIDAILSNNLIMEELLKYHKDQHQVVQYSHSDRPLGVYFTKQFLADKPSFLAHFNNQIADCRVQLGLKALTQSAHDLVHK